MSDELAGRLAVVTGGASGIGEACAVRLAEAMVGLGLTTSKLCTYAAPEPKVITGWPLSQLLGSRPGSDAGNAGRRS